MFGTLRNEARLDIELDVVTPLAIMAGESNILDPSRPDNQVVTQWVNGRMTPYIPGSSLKGVFRSRAEQLLRGLGVEVDDPISKPDKTQQSKTHIHRSLEHAWIDKNHVYFKNCPVSQLFGSLSMKGRVTFRDAYPVDPDKIVLGTRQNVGIDRISGGSKNKTLFDREVVESGSFSTVITLHNFELWQLSLIFHLLMDLHEGYLRLGASTTRGLGKVNVKLHQVTIRQYGALPGNPAPICGAIHSDDTTQQTVTWKKDLFGHTFSQEGFDFWIGENGILNDLKTAPWLDVPMH
ncbi:MAG: CRISPR-associated RAMP protein [Bacillus thermozeamaize]|uniref:CRISPR-associated RAMP protein n=1 Tax=Bacillus thermozeamaize TaxID=230954 RepID=A0A1Y3PFA1_9BACI|nr:MAG: CRISPR-associated RAMP protein [Bacillus thermozeamaize]